MEQNQVLVRNILAAIKTVRIKFRRENFARSTVQRRMNAVLKGATSMLGKDKCALGTVLNV